MHNDVDVVEQIPPQVHYPHKMQQTKYTWFTRGMQENDGCQNGQSHLHEDKMYVFNGCMGRTMYITECYRQW